MNKDIEILQKQFNSLCDEQDKHYRKEFEDVFAIIRDMDKTTSKDLPFTTEVISRQALEKAGYSNDINFVADFLEYERIFREGQDVQRQILELLATSMPSATEPASNEWRFISMRIIASQPLMQIVDEVVMKDAIAGLGTFANLTEIPDEDEELDAYLLIDAYSLKCSLVPFLDDLKNYGIADGFLSKDLTRLLLWILKREVVFIKDNTTTPAKIKNHIRKTIKVFDDMPIWGIFFQILAFQGLCRWFECINIDEGDDGYREAQSLYDWTCKQLISKEIEFCYKPYGDGDKEILKPLCNYLYSTELGKLVQSKLFNTEESQQTIAQESEAGIQLPAELNTPTAQTLFDKAIKAGLAEKSNGGYTWKGQSNELAAFIDCSSTSLKIRPSNGRVPWKLYKQAFGLTDKEIKAAQDAKKDYDMERRAKPESWDAIHALCSL